MFCFSEDFEITYPYQKQLDIVKGFLTCEEKDRPNEEIVKRLGTSIAALYSVPTAIYCFLRAQTAIPGIKVRRWRQKFTSQSKLATLTHFQTHENFILRFQKKQSKFNVFLLTLNKTEMLLQIMKHIKQIYLVMHA